MTVKNIISRMFCKSVNGVSSVDCDDDGAFMIIPTAHNNNKNNNKGGNEGNGKNNDDNSNKKKKRLSPSSSSQPVAMSPTTAASINIETEPLSSSKCSLSSSESEYSTTPSSSSSYWSRPIYTVRNNANSNSSSYSNSWDNWLRKYHISLIYWLILSVMVLIMLMVWLMLQMAMGYAEQQQQLMMTSSEMPVTSTFLSLQVFSNGSVQVSKDDPTQSPTNEDVDLKAKLEQERIMARERVKQNHLNYIRDQLMHILLAGRTPPSPNVTASSLSGDVVRIKEVVENGPPPTPKMVMMVPNSPNSNSNGVNKGGSSRSSDTNEYFLSEIYAQRLQSFYPSCDTTILDWLKTNDNDGSIENLKLEMKLYFDLSIPKSPDSRTHITIMWAKLRLFMFNGPPCDDTLVPSRNEDDREYSDKASRCDSNKITISLFQYVPPITQNHYANIRLIDRHTLSSSYRGHIEFNVQSVIDEWQNHQANYGLLVRVEDRFNNKLEPSLFLYQMNCSDSALPVPNLAGIYGKSINNTAVNNNNNKSVTITLSLRNRYPTLDLMTMESARNIVPEQSESITSDSRLSSTEATMASRSLIGNLKQLINLN